MNSRRWKPASRWLALVAAGLGVVLALSGTPGGSTLALFSSSQTGSSTGSASASSSFTYPLNWSTTTPGTYQVTWPAGVSTLGFTICGGNGAAGTGILPGAGAVGGCVTGGLSAGAAPTSSSTITVYVAGSGSGSTGGTGYASGGAGGAGTNVGGGGGGSSAILFGGSTNSNVLVIAPGGAGGGAGQTGHAGGAGGAGAAASPSANGSNGTGGAGGGAGGGGGAKATPTSLNQAGGTATPCGNPYGSGGGGAGSAGGNAGTCNNTSGGGGGGGASYVNTTGFAVNTITYKVTTGPTGAASTGATGSASIVLVTTPAFVNSATASTPVGSTFSIAVTATGSPTPTITETGSLPSGVTFVDNGNGTATFSGTSAVPSGSYPFTLTATNAAGSGTQSFVLNITQAPTITSAAAAALQIGIAGTFTVTTSGTPAPSLTESGTLPSGVIFTDNGDGTATLSGTPAAGTVGSYSLNVSATNSQGSVSQTFTLYILSASLAASGTISSGASVSTSTTVSAGPTYLILAFDHDSGNTGNTLTASSSGFSTAPVLTAVGSQQNYDNNAAHYSAWYTTGGAGSGTFTVALANSTTKGANIEVIQLGGNNTSAPTVNGNLGSTNSGATTANKGTTGDANLPAAPAAGDLEVIFDTATGNQGASSPASSPSSLVLVPSTYSAGSNVTVGVLSGPATQAETLTWANSVVWGTMSIEIAHG